MNVTYYRGKRVYLRPIETVDAPTLVRWINDPDNWKTLGRNNPINELREREYIERLYKSDTDVVLGIDLADGTFIGCCGLRRICLKSRSASFGVLIGEKKYQGRRYGTEVTRLTVQYGFEELNLNRIELDVFADNQRGVGAYRRAGFVEEGRMRQAVYRNGRYHDMLRFAILRSEWEDADAQSAAQGRLSSMST